jgi:hypothetical protein
MLHFGQTEVHFGQTEAHFDRRRRLTFVGLTRIEILSSKNEVVYLRYLGKYSHMGLGSVWWD